MTDIHCPWQSGYGLPWAEICDKAMPAGRDFCDEHMAVLTGDATYQPEEENR